MAVSCQSCADVSLMVAQALRAKAVWTVGTVAMALRAKTVWMYQTVAKALHTKAVQMYWDDSYGFCTPKLCTVKWTGQEATAKIGIILALRR